MRGVVLMLCSLDVICRMKAELWDSSRTYKLLIGAIPTFMVVLVLLIVALGFCWYPGDFNLMILLSFV